MKPPSLPTKTCPACNRPFAWRRKWARSWEEIKFCSDACRTGRYTRAKNPPTPRLVKTPPVA